MKKIKYLIYIIIVILLLMSSLSNVVLAKEGVINDFNQTELIKQTLTISGDTVKFVGIIATIILPLIIFLIGYQMFKSYQFEKEFKDIKKSMISEYEKILEIRSDSEKFLNETKSKLTNLENFIGDFATNYLRENASEFISKEVKEETDRRISAEIKTIDDQKNRNIELLKKLEALDLTLTPTVYIERGTIYFEQKNYEKAVENYTKAIELKENNFEAYFNRGLAYQREEKWDEAIKDYIKSSQIDPNSKESFTNISMCYLAKEDSKSAMENINKVIELDSKYAFAHYQKARIYNYMKKYDLAINEINEALKTEPNNPIYLFNLGLYYGKMGNYRAAIENYLKSNEKSIKKNIYTMLNLTEGYLCEKNYIEAEKLAHECYSLSLEMREKILSKYLLLASLILSNKEYRLELKAFVESITAESDFKMLTWSFDEILDCFKDSSLPKPAVELVKKIIEFLKGNVKKEDLLSEY